MPSRYDTNPLDPDFPEKARTAAASDETQTLPYRGGETRPFPEETATTDEQQTPIAELLVDGKRVLATDPQGLVELTAGRVDVGDLLQRH